MYVLQVCRKFDKIWSQFYKNILNHPICFFKGYDVSLQWHKFLTSCKVERFSCAMRLSQLVSLKYTVAAQPQWQTCANALIWPLADNKHTRTARWVGCSQLWCNVWIVYVCMCGQTDVSRVVVPVTVCCDVMVPLISAPLRPNWILQWTVWYRISNYYSLSLATLF